MTEKLWKTVDFTMTQKEAEDWNNNTFEGYARGETYYMCEKKKGEK